MEKLQETKLKCNGEIREESYGETKLESNRRTQLEKNEQTREQIYGEKKSQKVTSNEQTRKQSYGGIKLEINKEETGEESYGETRGNIDIKRIVKIVLRIFNQGRWNGLKSGEAEG